jgi:protein arginine kinase activator
MLCDACQKDTARVYLTQIVEGKMQKINLCEACASEKGVDDPTGFALADLLLGLGSHEQVKKVTGDPTCAVCGFTQTDFKKTGRLGCSACYSIFGEGLDGLLKAMHKGTRHIGKVPASFAQTKAMRDRLRGLEEQLAGPEKG